MGEMKRNRRDEDRRNRPDLNPNLGDDEQQLAEARRKAKALLRAGDEAISRALSGDSREFLKANEQKGGQ